MLELYFIKPSTVDRIRANLFGGIIERYVEWMRSRGYAARNVYRRVPILCHFGDFAKKRGAVDAASALAHVDDFVLTWRNAHGPSCTTEESRRKVAHDARHPVVQMLEFALHGAITMQHRRRNPFPFLSLIHI